MNKTYLRTLLALAVACLLAGCDVETGRTLAGLTGTPAASPTASGRTGSTSIPSSPTTVAGAQAATAAGGGAVSAQTMSLPNGLNAVQVVETARPSVVNITTAVVSQDQLRRPVQQEAGAGTGVVFDPRGYVLTNSHVVRSGGSQPAPVIKVTLSDDRTFDAQLIDDDPQNDLAIVKIDASNLSAAKLGDSDKLRIGEPVVAIGNALALPGGPTVSTGVVSALGRTIDEPNGVSLVNLVQTDAAINPGNSGGPLLDGNAEVIGINTAGATQAQGIAFAVAINQAKPAMESVKATGKVVRPILGVRIIADITPAIARANNLQAQRGVAVSPTPGGPAAQAGVRDDDVVVGADGQEIKSTPELLAAVRKHKPGEQMRLRIQRGTGAPLDVTVTLGQQ